MTPEQFCYWLQGRVETLPEQVPTESEWQIIRDHLKLVFDKQTPHRFGPVEILPMTAPVQHQPPSYTVTC